MRNGLAVARPLAVLTPLHRVHVLIVVPDAARVVLVIPERTHIQRTDRVKVSSRVLVNGDRAQRRQALGVGLTVLAAIGAGVGQAVGNRLAVNGDLAGVHAAPVPVLHLLGINALHLAGVGLTATTERVNVHRLGGGGAQQFHPVRLAPLRQESELVVGSLRDERVVVIALDIVVNAEQPLGTVGHQLVESLLGLRINVRHSGLS